MSNLVAEVLKLAGIAPSTELRDLSTADLARITEILSSFAKSGYDSIKSDRVADPDRIIENEEDIEKVQKSIEDYNRQLRDRHLTRKAELEMDQQKFREKYTIQPDNHPECFDYTLKMFNSKVFLKPNSKTLESGISLSHGIVMTRLTGKRVQISTVRIGSKNRKWSKRTKLISRKLVDAAGVAKAHLLKDTEPFSFLTF